jgi:TRAP-type C4-dicarboxylate transport system substrate-binding protein
MFKPLVRLAAVAAALLPLCASAEPVTLKLAFFTSDRSTSYRGAVKPFLDAVNQEGKGLVEIVLYSGGVLGREVAKQPQVVLDGMADIAFMVPGYTPDRFPDNTLLELPGLFGGMREATFAYTRLVASGTLSGYQDFFAIGAYVTEPETIHSRVPIASLAELRGKKIRVNNPGEAAVFERLGAIPVPMQINRVTDAISNGSIDAASTARTPLSDYGIRRVAANHFMFSISGAPLALLMNRRKFESLPDEVRRIIVKHSGEWAAAHFVDTYEKSDAEVFAQLKADPQRKVIFPSQEDLDAARAVFKSVIREWADKSPRNHELLEAAEAEIAKLRSSREGPDAIIR